MTTTSHFASPDDAEQAFYDAIGQGEADALMRVWAEDEETVCIHPTGARIAGLNLIRESWRAIFANARLKVQAEPMAQWHGMLMAVHHLTETLFVGDDPNPHGPLHVTHVFIRGAHGWRMVSRHASAAGEGPALAGNSTHTLH